MASNVNNYDLSIKPGSIYKEIERLQRLLSDTEEKYNETLQENIAKNEMQNTMIRFGIDRAFDLVSPLRVVR